MNDLNLKLIPPDSQYAKIFYDWRNQPSTQKFNPLKDFTLKELKYNLENTPVTLKNLQENTSYRWFIKMNEKLVGTVSLAEINLMMGLGEIGYMVGEDYHGKGVATQALKMWTDFIFELTNLRRLTASVAEGNLASLRVLEKAGYKKEGVLREHYLIKGVPTTQVVFGILKNDRNL